MNDRTVPRGPFALGMGPAPRLLPEDQRASLRPVAPGAAFPDLDARAAKNAESARRGGLDASGQVEVRGSYPRALAGGELVLLVARSGADVTRSSARSSRAGGGRRDRPQHVLDLALQKAEEGWRKGYCYLVLLQFLTSGSVPGPARRPCTPWRPGGARSARSCAASGTAPPRWAATWPSSWPPAR